MTAIIRVSAETIAERTAKIAHLLGIVEAGLAEQARSSSFIKSIRHQFDLKGWLSDKQIKALESFRTHL